MLALWKKSFDKPRQCIKKQRHFPDKGPYSQSYGFSSSHVWMWELNYKEGWAPKNGYFRIVVLETVVLESPLDSKEIKPVSPRGNQPWIFTGRTDAKAKVPILWPPDAGKDWRQEENGQQKMRWLDGIIDSMDMNLSKPWETVKDREVWHVAVHGVTKSWTRLSA